MMNRHWFLFMVGRILHLRTKRIVHLCETYRFRCIARDRRRFDKSEWNGPGAANLKDIDYDVFADDIIYLISPLLKLKSFVLVGSSMGAGETLPTWLRSTYVRERCKISLSTWLSVTVMKYLRMIVSTGFVWVCFSMPHPIQLKQNPLMAPYELWDDIVAGFRNSRAEYTRTAFPAALVQDKATQLPPSVRQRYEYIDSKPDAIALKGCVKIITTYNFRPLLEKLGSLEANQPAVLSPHGQFDPGMPYEASSKVIGELFRERK